MIVGAFGWIANGGMDLIANLVFKAGAWLRASHKADVADWAWDQ